MINQQEEAIKRLIALAKTGAQRTPLVPRVSADIPNPDVGMLWIREDEQKAYLRIDEDTTLLVASSAPLSGEGAIAERSLPGVTLQLNTVTSDELATNSVTDLELAPGAVTGDSFADLVSADTSLTLTSALTTSPALTLNVGFDHNTDIFRVLNDGVQRFRIDATHTSIGEDLPGSAFSVQTAGTDYALRVRGAGGAILAERANGQRLFSIDASGNLVVAGAISSLSGDSDTAGSMAINGALTVTDQANFLGGLQVAERVDFLAEFEVNGQSTFNAEPSFPSNYSAKIGEAVHLRTITAEEDRLILEGVSDINRAELQFGTGGPVLSGSLAQPDRMFIGSSRIVTSAAEGIFGSQLAKDTVTGGNGPGVGNIAAETIYGYNIKNGSITSTELSPGAVVRAAIDAGAVGSVELADGSVIDRVVASMGVGKLISGTLNADEIFMGPSGHIYLGPTFESEILDERVQIDSSGIRAYNAFNTPLAEFTPGGFTLRTGVDGARLEFDAATGLELFGLTGERTGYLSPLGEFQLDSMIDGARMTLNSQDGVEFYAGATTNLAYNPGFIGSSEHELAVAGEAFDDQRHVFAGEYAVRFRSTNPNVNAPSYVDVPFKNTVGTGTSVTRTRVNLQSNPGLQVNSSNWSAGAPTAQTLQRVAVLGFINDFAAQVTATAPGAGWVATPPVGSILPGNQIACSVSVRVSTAQNVTAEINWYDVNWAVIRTDRSVPFALKSNVVTQIGLVGVAPAAAQAAAIAVSASLSTTDVLQVSDCLVERASGIGDYFDGNRVGFQWDGTPGLSQSSLIPVPVLDSANNLLSIFVWSDVEAWAQIEGRDSTAGVGRGLSTAQRLTPNQWSRISVQCSGRMDKVRLHYPSTDPARQDRITDTPIWWSGLQVEADKDVPTPFCSGNEPGCRWEGLEARSPSIRDRDVVVTRISPTLGTHVSGAIVGGSLTSASFFAGRIFGTYINGGVIEGNIIRGNQINGDQILAGTIQGTSIAARTIDAGSIKANSLTAAEIAAATITGDRIVAGTLTATQIGSRSITADRLVAGSITAVEIGAREITSDKLQSDLILSSRIVVGAALTGARLELTPGTGLQAFTAGGMRTFWIDSATGNITAVGTWRTGVSGERIEILTDGTQRFYSTGTAYGEITNNNGNLRMRGTGSGQAGFIELSGINAGFNFGTPGGTVLTGVGVSGNFFGVLAAFSGHRLNGQVAPDAVGRRAFFLHTNSSGSDIGSLLLQYGSNGEATPRPVWHSPTNNSAITFGANEIWITNNALSGFGPIAASVFNVNSSIELKDAVKEIEFSSSRTSWDIIEGAPSLEWAYTNEDPNQLPEKPMVNGQPVKLRVRNPNVSAEVWDSLSDYDSLKWLEVDAEWPSDMRKPPRRSHRFPIAEDLVAMNVGVVSNYTGRATDQRVDLRDMVGILWDAVDMLIKRNRLVEERLRQRLPLLVLPPRPQRGDVVEGIGALIPGRTRRVLDAETGQVRSRIIGLLGGS